jgi:two-component system phosphate regulon sensor histidine kinase PhoR
MITFAAIASLFCLILMFLHYRQSRELAKLQDARHFDSGNLAEAQQRLLTRLEIEQTIMDSLPDPLLLISKNRKILRANRSAFDLLGAKLLNQDVDGLLRDKGVRDAISSVLNGQPPHNVEFIWNGSVMRNYMTRITTFKRFWDSAQSPVNETDTINIEDSEWPAVMILMNDITAIKRSDETRIDFIANISHELRTPLASLIGFIETIRGPAKDDAESKDRFLGIMHDQAQRMARLVSDLLSLSRAELEEHRMPTERVNLIKLLGNLWAAMELRAAEKGITINVESPRELPEVYGDWDQLIQAFINLVENAIKYGHENSEIIITATVQNDGVHPSGRPREMVAISVTDQGDGIPKENLEKLTERFYRADSAKARRIPGTGLGLAIVKHIVNRHHGRLTIASEVGRGTSFTVHLPSLDEETLAENMTMEKAS